VGNHTTKILAQKDQNQESSENWKTHREKEAQLELTTEADSCEEPIVETGIEGMNPAKNPENLNKE